MKKVMTYLILMFAVIVFGCSEDDTLEIMEECPFELVNLTEHKGNFDIFYFPLISQNSEYIVSESDDILTLSTFNYEIIDTIYDNTGSIRYCSWTSDTTVRYRNKDDKNWYSYNLNNRESVIANDQEFAFRCDIFSDPKKLEIYLEDEWITIIDTTAYIFDYHISKNKDRIIFGIGNKTRVYEISGKSISKIAQMDEYGAPIGWIDNDYFLYFNAIEGNYTYEESDYYIAKYDCSSYWKVTNDEVMEGYGSISEDKVLFKAINNSDIFAYDLVRK
ncbi:MAG: hypothetical protein PF485_06245 [Bacteroidales bacterium]|jgi:hypothetical protein|nr:hypothetical protein [Bacteroidales bacterium]